MNVIRWSAVVGVMLTAFAAAVVTAPTASAQGTDAVGVALPVPVAQSGREGVAMVSPGTQILTFTTGDVTHAQKAMTIIGMGSDRLLGIDYRPNTGKLYGVGRSGAIYLIDDLTAVAMSVGRLSVKPSLSGGTSSKGADIDFTPAGDQLRFISNTGQNMHQAFGSNGRPTGATVVDGKLSRKNVAAMAYDDTGRLIDIDTKNAQVVLQNPKSGKLTNLGPAGAFPKLSTDSNGIDIAGSDAFAVVNLNHDHTLFSVNTTDGTATRIGVFPDHVIDLTLKR